MPTLLPRIFLVLLVSGGFISCDKEPVGESQGTNFNLLLKTITKNNFNTGHATTHFTYNNNNQLIALKYSHDYPSSAEEQTENFYRNNTGRLDSIVFGTISNGYPVTIKTFFTYDGLGKLVKSIQKNLAGTNLTTDSSIYVYSGNSLLQRIDYRSFNGGPFSLLRQGYYSFDGTGNLIRMIFQWPQSNIIDTARLEYDTKINPIPLDRLLGHWAPFFYDDYKPVNNPTLFLTEISESFSNEYTYAPNNKPLYRKSKVIGSANAYYETWFYYD